jgi:hypothetical protein
MHLSSARSPRHRLVRHAGTSLIVAAALAAAALFAVVLAASG